MGRRSVKDNKNIYQQSRENKGLSREGAEEILSFVSADRIEKIESGRSTPHPDEVLHRWSRVTKTRSFPIITARTSVRSV